MLSNDEREEIITVLMMRKNYSETFLTNQSDEQLQKLMHEIDTNELVGDVNGKRTNKN